MTRLDTTCYWLSILSATLLAYSTNHVIAYQRPLHCALFALATCACLLIAASKALPNALFNTARSRPSSPTYALLPRTSSNDDLSSETSRTVPTQQTRSPVILRVLAVACLSIRLELYRRVAHNPECAIATVEIWLPLLLVLYDSLRYQHPRRVDGAEKIDNTIYESLSEIARRRLLGTRFRNVLPVALFCWGCQSLQNLWVGLNSTYICPIVTGEHTTVPMAQTIALLIDLGLIIIAWEFFPSSSGAYLTPQRNVLHWGMTMAGAVAVWVVVGAVVYAQKIRMRYYVVLWDVDTFSMLSSFALQAILCSVAFATTTHSAIVYGVIEMTLTLSATLMLVPSVLFMWSASNPFPPFSKLAPTCSFALLYFGWWLFKTIRHSPGQCEQGPYRPKLLFLFGLALLIPAWFKHTIMHYHPIDLLIYEASLQHAAYLNMTSTRGTLSDAVKNYQLRYHRNPPPGFDKWWEYATNRSTLIIDEYDQIHNDIQPFYSVSPADLRRLTWEIASNKWNEASGIHIRDGLATVQDNVIPTHRWMLEGVAELINSFATYLPDMDLVFNINDEPRVVAPHDKLDEYRRIGAQSSLKGTQSFSANRAAGWQPESTDFAPHNFRAASFRQHYLEFGSVGCDPSSPARQGYTSGTSRADLCIACTKPHSLGQFVSNWTRAADICHQPDMANLHGFYMSPAAFKPAYALKPVFSQSKPQGFNDILYPSAWNYMDKVKYEPSEQKGNPGDQDYRPAYPDPPLREKAATLFWRGATSEGVSGGGGQWRGMARQRLIHLVNNGTSHPQDDALVLLPHPRKQSKWQYTRIPGDKVKDLGISTDVHTVSYIARCGDDRLLDCKDQEKEFRPVAPSDFQAHWMYKYLFDLDGAGFSGRFLPFLQSRSLPFKSALFREWYDSRLTAWRHFVPQDLRLHGVWSTLAYFAGVDGTLPNGRRIKWAGHDIEAEMIAEAGRDWAKKVLRKEDMEVYFFRLLLEWGRMTDDNREELGFVMP